MISANLLLPQGDAGLGVHRQAVDLVVAVNSVRLLGKELVAALDVIDALRTPIAPQLPVEVLPGGVDNKLIGGAGVVAKAVIQVVIKDRGAGAEGDDPAKIREEVNTVVVVPLNDGSGGPSSG